MNSQHNLRTWCMNGNTPDFQSGELGSNPRVRITLDLVDSNPKKFAFDQIVKGHHTYKPTTDIVGRVINWLIKCNGEVIGAIGVGSSVMAMKPRDDYIGWKKEQRLKNLVKTATNWRYCLIKKGKFTSQILSLFAKEARKEWKKKFGNTLVMLETLVEPPYTGQSYLASGWIKVGETKGCEFKWKKKDEILPTDKVVQKFMKFGKQKDENTWKVHTGSNKKKHILIKPLHRLWRKELCSTTKEDNNNETNRPRKGETLETKDRRGFQEVLGKKKPEKTGGN